MRAFRQVRGIPIVCVSVYVCVRACARVRVCGCCLSCSNQSRKPQLLSPQLKAEPLFGLLQ